MCHGIKSKYTYRLRHAVSDDTGFMRAAVVWLTYPLYAAVTAAGFEEGQVSCATSSVC